MSADAAAEAELVLAERRDRVLVLRLNRPAARNALDSATRQQLIRHLRSAADDASVGAVVLTGEGSAFAAGADLRELLARSTEEQRHFLQPPHIYSTIEDLPKPVVAAINGHALGAGLELATACDVRVCSEAAKLGQPEVSLALIPGGGGTQRLARLVGRGQASRLVMTGEAVAAAEALAMGLVDVLAPKDKVVEEAVRVAAAMARHDPAALAAAKRCLQAAGQVPYPEGLRLEVDEFVRLHAREESKARVRGFLEKA